VHFDEQAVQMYNIPKNHLIFSVNEL